MPILDAALAFALTMLLVATVVSRIVAVLQRVARTRQKQMAAMLDVYFDKELRPVVDRELKRLASRVQRPVTDALSRAAGTVEKKDLFAHGTANGEALEAVLARAEHLDTSELIEQLKRTDFGGELLEALDDGAERVFAELGARWEVVGKRFTASFRRHSGRWATGVALVLAVGFNIDSVFILDSYVSDRNLAASVAVQVDQIRVDAEHAIALTADTTSAVDSAAVAEVRDQIDRLTKAGLPMGWDLFPYACFQGGDHAECAPGGRLARWAWWILGVLLTAGLAGLGAPFWYDVVSGIAKVARVGRSTGPSPAR